MLSPVRRMGQRSVWHRVVHGIGQRYPTPNATEKVLHPQPGTISVERYARILSILFCAWPGPIWGQGEAEMDANVLAFITEHQKWIHQAHGQERFTASNPDMGLRASIDANGLTLTAIGDPSEWQTRLRINGLGRTIGHWIQWEPGGPCGMKRELIWAGTAMDVQYLNGDDGLRQNFIVHERPAGHGPFKIGLTWESDLNGVQLNDHGAVFTDKHGEIRHTYDDLHVFDACGRILGAWMEVDPTTSTITLHVDDHLADYPITVDPISTTFNTQVIAPAALAGAAFGYSVSSAGDLNGDGYSDIAIGAPYATLGETEEGAVYVYHGGPNGIVVGAPTILESNWTNARFGVSVAHAGDVNGDGFSDLIVGAHTYANPAGHTNEGSIWVFLGSTTGISNVPDQIIQPNRVNTYLGFDVAGLGDINGDGYSDIAGGCSLYTNGHSNEGAVYVYLGSATGLSTPECHRLEPHIVSARFGSSVSGAGDINGDGFDDMVAGAFGIPNGGAFRVFYGSDNVQAGVARPFGNGVNPAAGQQVQVQAELGNNRIGWAVAGAGDVNGDGYSDVIMGDWQDTDDGQNNEGGFMMFHGSATGLATSPAYTRYSGQVGASMGYSVSTAGDVNSDGYADVLVGVVNRAPVLAGVVNRPGAVELYLGGPDGITGDQLIRFTPPNDQNNARMGHHVACAGDVNGDGFSDLILPIPYFSSNPASSPGDASSSRFRIVHGAGYGMLLNTLGQTAPPRIDIFTEANGHAGWSVANAGDVNGDGLSDVIVGIPDAGDGLGQVHIHHGTPDGPSITPALVLNGTIPGGRYGASVATAGDVNGDGYADVVIGAPEGSGQFTIHLGGPGGLSSEMAVVASGLPGSQFGAVVATAGDVNCDGMADVLVAAPGSGVVHVYHGSMAGLTVPPALSIPSPQPGSGFGSSVATAGDVNGDGYSDIIIGAPDFSNGEPGEGAAFVYFGAPDGIDPVVHRQLEGNEAGIAFGTSVAGAGDMNGNGVSDVVVGAPMKPPNGAIHVFHGTVGGLSGTVDYTYNAPAGFGDAARFGAAVAEGGDIDGNGLADIVVGAPSAFNPAAQVNEGRVYVLLFMPAGAPNVTFQEPNVANRQLGFSVAGGGDIDGDGFSDIIAGAPFTVGVDGTQTGAVYFFPGNARKGLSRPARQYQADLVSPLSTNSEDFLNADYFGVGLLARSHMQRKPGRLHWEVVNEGMPFSGAPNIATSVVSQGNTPYQDLGPSGVEIKQLLYKQPGFIRYKWRVRVEYPLHRSGPDGQRFGKWHYGYASAHGDIGILPVELLLLDGVPLIPGNLITWSTATETHSSHYVVERSTDMETFHPIGEVPAAGQSAVTTEYELLDDDAPSGVSYYRLRMVDLDGTEELSPSVSVYRSTSGEMQVFPNPVDGSVLHWQGPANAEHARVHDATGRRVTEARVTSGTIGTLEMAHLTSGHYTLILLDVNGQVLARSPFIKQ